MSTATSRKPAKRKNAPRAAATERRDVYQEVTDRLIAGMESGTAPWKRPWKLTGGGSAFPLSMTTSKPYRGVNVFLLGITALSEGYSSPWWGTYDRIAELSGMKQMEGRNGHKYWVSPDGTPRGVRKGEKHSLSIFWRQITVDDTDAETGETRKKRIPLLKAYSVFNADQAAGLPERYQGLAQAAGEEQVPASERAAAVHGAYLARETGLAFGHADASRAWYSSRSDRINVPPLSGYATEDEYWSTTWHEDAHSTGHASRLGRLARAGYDCRFGSPDYAEEELVAEMGAAMLAGLTGTSTPDSDANSAAYLRGWIAKLKGDKKLAVVAAGRAQKAADYILGVRYENENGEAEAA